MLAWNSTCFGQFLCPKHVVSCQNKFVKLVHLVGFIIKKFVTMHGHMNVKKTSVLYMWEAKFSQTQCWSSAILSIQCLSQTSQSCSVLWFTSPFAYRGGWLSVSNWRWWKSITNMHAQDIIHDCVLKPWPQTPVFLILVKKWRYPATGRSGPRGSR